jgi:hypothetical protein
MCMIVANFMIITNQMLKEKTMDYNTYPSKKKQAMIMVHGG